METLIGLPLLALITGIALQIILEKVLSRRWKGWIAFLAGLTSLITILTLVPTIAKGSPIDANLFSWDGNISYQVHVDGLSLIFALMATGIGSAILFYCIDYMADESQGSTRFYVLMLTFILGLVSLVFSANLLLAYISWELIGLCSYFLVGFWYQNSAAANGARKVLVMTHIPGYALLIGILLLYTHTDTFLWTDPTIAANFSTGIFLLMLVAAMAKSVMVPLHTWIPEAMNAPTPVSALLHSACYVKAGIYLVARMISLHPIPWPISWQSLVLIIGCLTMLVGALFALKQTDLKRLLAFSTISQLGYLITGLGIGTPAAIAAALFYTFSHGLFKGTLFLCAGSVQHGTGTRDMRELGGLSSKFPRTTLAWLIAAAAIIGVPLTNGFVSKWLLFDAALGANQWLVVSVAWLVSVITAFYILKATVSIFFSPLPESLQEKHLHEPLSMQVGMLTLASISLIFGIAPQILDHWLIKPAVVGFGISNAPTLNWFGIHNSSDSANTLIGALIILLALGISWILISINRNKVTSTSHIFSGGEALPQDNTVSVEDFADIAENALQPIYTITDPDPFYMKIWEGLVNFTNWLKNIIAPLENRPILASIVISLIVFISVWLV